MSFFENHELVFFVARALYHGITKNFAILWLCVAAVLVGYWLFLMRNRCIGVINNNAFATFAGLFVVSYLLLMFLLIPWHAHIIWRDNPYIVSPWGIIEPDISSDGRYTPIAQQQWRIFLYFLDGEKGWFTVVALEFVLTSLALFFVLMKENGFLPALTGVLVFVTDVGVATVYGDTIFSERYVIIGFLLFVYGSLGYKKHYDTPYALIAAMGAHLALYNKEVSLIFLGVTSVTYIVTDLLTKPTMSSSDRNWQKFWKNYAPEIITLAMCFAFIVMYVVSIFPIRQGESYGGGSFQFSEMIRVSLRDLFNYRIVFMILAIPLLLLPTVRKVPTWAFYFALAAGSLSYVISYSIVGFEGYYYRAPAIGVFVLVLGWLMANLLSVKWQKLSFLGAIALVLILETFPIPLIDKFGRNPSDIDHSSYVLPKGIAATLDYRFEMAHLYQVATYLKHLEEVNPSRIRVIFDGQYPWMVRNFISYTKNFLGVRFIASKELRKGDYIAVLSRNREYVEQHFGGSEYREIYASGNVFRGLFSTAQDKKKSYVFEYIGRN